MAFDMYLGKERESIEYYEEVLFSIIKEDDSYPKLNWIWEEFYNGPLILPNDANEIVHELITLRTQISKNDEQESLINMIDRLLPFLNKAYKMNEKVRCISD